MRIHTHQPTPQSNSNPQELPSFATSNQPAFLYTLPAYFAHALQVHLLAVASRITLNTHTRTHTHPQRFRARETVIDVD